MNHLRREQKDCLYCGKSLINKSGKKYCSQKCQQAYQRRLFWTAVETTGRFPDNTHPITIKSHLLEQHGYSCAQCGGTEWQGCKMPLQLDHINGDSGDEELVNLRLLCPNCHALTPSYAGRNLGNGRVKRRQRYKEGKSS